jgi:hypothetical protein
MFGGRKISLQDRAFGALRSASPPVAPRLEFQARGRSQKVDLRQYCSPVEDQLTISSCNACSVVGALEYLMIRAGKPLINLSPMFVYYNGRRLAGMENQDSGLMSHHATAAVMAYGACEEKVWPYKVEKYAVPPPRNCYQDATRFEAIQYARLASSEEAKVSLSEGVPVVFGFDMPRAYYDAAATTGIMPNAGAFDSNPQTGHSMLVVGYDDAEKTWLVRNSWGDDYGEKGYVRIPYDLASKYVWNDDMWVMGSLATLDRARLLGPTVDEAVRNVQAHGAEEMSEALKKLGKEIAGDLKSRTDSAKTSIRDRLRAQEDELARKREKKEP